MGSGNTNVFHNLKDILFICIVVAGVLAYNSVMSYYLSPEQFPTWVLPVFLLLAPLSALFVWKILTSKTIHRVLGTQQEEFEPFSYLIFSWPLGIMGLIATQFPTLLTSVCLFYLNILGLYPTINLSIFSFICGIFVL